MFWYARKKGNRDEIQSSSLNPFISSSSGVGKSVKSTPFPTQGNIITGPQEQHYTDVRTNTVNRRTMFASWHLHYDLNGANGLENEGCVASWELYP